MAKIIAVGNPVNDAERRAIAHLRDHLPNTYTILHNFEITQGSENFEIDLAILGPHCIFVADVKGTHGLIDIYGAKWYPDGRQPHHSPLAKLRQHAKILKALICEAYPEKQELRGIHVHATVVLAAQDARVVDHSGRDVGDVVSLEKCVAYFQSQAHIPSQRSHDIQTLLHLAEKAICGKARPKLAPLCYRDWQVVERLGGNDSYTEYRAKHTYLGKHGGTVRLRVYRVDPYQDEKARKAEWQLISNAFRAVAHMPVHPNILAVRDFFSTEDQETLVLVTEDVLGKALRQHIKKPDLALTSDQKLRILQDVLVGLDHAHTHEVIHRNLTPDAILISADGQARLTVFDYARVGVNRSSTIAQDIIDDVDPTFQAPECYRDPAQASAASDLFSAGLVFYELLTGELAFEGIEQIFDLNAIFPVKPSELRTDLPPGFDNWLQKLCKFNPKDRFPSAAVALQELSSVIASERPLHHDHRGPVQPAQPQNFTDLPRDSILGGRFVIRERLGHPGGFAVAYKVFDTLGDVVRVLKLVTRDRQSVFERLRREYKALLQIPEHPYVVKVIWADRFPDETPYIIFEYVEGLDIGELLASKSLSIEDAITIVQQAAEGLSHLHKHGVYHQDIKPSNLLWTGRGVKIIDFNVAVSSQDESSAGGGTRRYIPPDIDPTLELTTQEKIDRDLYVLGITFYECVTGQYPFDEPTPPRGREPRDPHEISGCEDLSKEFVHLLLESIAPTRPRRFSSAERFLEGIKLLPTPKKAPYPVSSDQLLSLPKSLTPGKPNFNPFVSHLLTLYSQSRHTNAGTRGLDTIGEYTYVSTFLDKELRPAVLRGEFRLVIISGNAGDGKTAFIQQLEKEAQKANAQVQRLANGSTFRLGERTFLSNYDGSQDEGEKINNEVLLGFLHPFQGSNTQAWPADETRLIAINEGRLIDFLTEHKRSFPRLAAIVRNGLRGATPEAGVALVNLNLRSVVADSGERGTAIFDRLIRRMTQERFWEACESCDLKERCYIYHNAHTFMDPIAGPKARERLKTLYAITHLRGRLHITLRDLRSALAFMLVGTRDCDGVHNLYHASGSEALNQILDGFYFNAWMGGTSGSKDRLISLLREIDMGEVSNPELDRSFAFLEPDDQEMGRFTYTERSHYDDDLFKKLFKDLPRAYAAEESLRQLEAHRLYVAMLRRRHYFERRDEGWRHMLPYRSAERFIPLITGSADLTPEVISLVMAINRGEGLADPSRLGNTLALRVRQVERGTIRSYRLFKGEAFSLARPDEVGIHRFIEYLPQTLLLRYTPPIGRYAELQINLDIYEMLTRLNNGYQPSVEDWQGFYLSLVVFKNILASAPFQEVLLTETGHEFYRVSRDEMGTLSLDQIQGREM